MLGVGGAATIAKNHQLVAVAKTLADGVDGVPKRLQIIPKEGLLDPNAFIEGLGDGVFHELFS
jgi:hypothetical protein